MSNREPLESSGIRRGGKRPKEVRQATHDRIEKLEEERRAEREEADEKFKETKIVDMPAINMYHYEASEVAANALIQDIVQNMPTGSEPDLAFTGGIRTAVQMLHNIGKNPSQVNFKALCVLMTTLERYVSSDA